MLGKTRSFPGSCSVFVVVVSLPVTTWCPKCWKLNYGCSGSAGWQDYELTASGGRTEALVITVIASRRVLSRKFLAREEKAVISISSLQQDEHCWGIYRMWIHSCVSLWQIVALREQNAHIQRKVASGDGGDDLLEVGDSQQKLHGKVSSGLLEEAGLHSWTWMWQKN